MSEYDEVHYWVVLHAVAGMGPRTFRRLVDRFGSARAVVEHGDVAGLSEVRAMTTPVAEAIAASAGRLDWAARMVDKLRQRGVRPVRMGDADYPAQLLDLTDPPPLLYMLGEIGTQDARSISMVGTTKPSKRGRPIAEEFARRFAAAGVTVVSGYAHGIDAASHRGAFDGGGRSVLCVPYGFWHFKSRGDFPALAEIAQRGAVVTECPPNEEWSARAAVARDRIIAALGRAVFVIETRRRGGTLHTVKAAEDLRRPLFVLKYQDPPEQARGNSILIARGATPIAKFGEVDTVLERLA